MSIIIGLAQLKPTQIDSKKTKWAYIHTIYNQTTIRHFICTHIWTTCKNSHTQAPTQIPLQELLNFEAEQFQIVKVNEAIKLSLSLCLCLCSFPFKCLYCRRQRTYRI